MLSIQQVNQIIKRLFFLAFFTFLLLFGMGCQLTAYPQDYEQLSTEERLVIRLSHVVGEETPKGLAARKFAQLMNERTAGYVEVQVFPNGYLYKDGEEIDALRRGDLQIIIPATSKVTQLVPEWGVIDLPFAFEDVDEVYEYLSSDIGKELMDKLKKVDMVALAIWDNGFKQITNNRNPIIYPEDANNLRFRIMPSEILFKQFEQIGASAEAYAFDEVFQLLEMNQIDGQENTFSNIASKNTYLLQEYLTVSNHGYLGYLFLVNHRFWNELSDDIKLIFQETLAEVTAWEKELAQTLANLKHEEIVNCNCIQIHYLSEEEKEYWETALMPVYDHYVKKYGDRYIKDLPKFKDD